MKKLTVIAMFFAMYFTLSQSAVADTSERLKAPDPNVSQWDFTLDQVSNFTAGYAFADRIYEKFFQRDVTITIDKKSVTITMGKRNGKLLCILLSLAIFEAKEKWFDTAHDSKDTGAAVLGVGAWLLHKNF